MKTFRVNVVLENLDMRPASTRSLKFKNSKKILSSSISLQYKSWTQLMFVDEIEPRITVCKTSIICQENITANLRICYTGIWKRKAIQVYPDRNSKRKKENIKNVRNCRFFYSFNVRFWFNRFPSEIFVYTFNK